MNEEKEIITTSANTKNKNRKKKVLIILIITIIVIGLTIGVVLFLKSKTKEEPKTTNTETKKLYSEYRMSGNSLENFDLRFLQLENNNKNVIYSPLSIKYALAMVSLGAKGQTKEQIDALIGDYESKKYTNSTNMSFANAMFIRDTYKNNINDKYKDNLKNKFNAEIIYDPFEQPTNINKWINDKTFNLINNLVDDDIKQKQFILANALAIDMEWKQKIQADADMMEKEYRVSYDHEDYSTYVSVIDSESYGYIYFNNNNTQKRRASEIGASLNNYDIVNDLGENNIRATITKEYEQWVAEDHCDMAGEYEATDTFVDKFVKELDSNYQRVDASTDFKFYIDDNVKAFEKELKEYNGITLEYIGIMPIKQELNQYINDMNAASINTVINNLKTVELNNVEKGKVTKIVGAIPLFKYDYQLDFEKDLKDLGVTNIFDSKKIDISNMTEDKNITFDASHKANIEFSNDGIKASAVTLMGGLGGIDCSFEHLYKVPVTKIDLTFDKPYMYLIRDKKTKEVWFMGTVYEPMEANQNSYSISENTNR